MTRKVITFDEGSKRRLDEIRWKVREIFSLVLLAIFVMAITVFVILWEVQREHPDSEPPKVPQIRDAEPTGP